ncbi:MAG: hypothetical protein U5P41_12575 [Gammaproteobacteria bacterium]|nr:hypothetical protein [Gammaproteobacteria bacterium]
MKFARKLSCGTILILLSGMVAAEEYKTPANMTNEDRQTLMAGSNEYEQCVTSSVRELAPRIGDPRALADAAMASCSNTLTAFAEGMATDNYHPDFSNYYIGRVKNRVANTAVQQAMIIVSQKQSQSFGKDQPDKPAVSE